MIPTLDLAKLFASRAAVKSTIITTPLNQPLLSKPIRKCTQLGLQIGALSLHFPGTDVGLPDDCQHFDQITSDDAASRFFRACAMLRGPLEQLLEEHRPDCLVADSFFPWATAAAAKFGIPRLIFDGTNYVSSCAMHSLRTHKPFDGVASDSDTFTIPNLPHELTLLRSQVSPFERKDRSEIGSEVEAPMAEFISQLREAERTSYGVVFNTFYGLEPDYADHFQKVLGRKSWSVGPLSLYNRETEDRALRGKPPTVGEKECLEWLDSKKTDSVVYICFGSLANFTDSQLREMAAGIEASEQEFIWVIRKTGDGTGEEEEEWMPEGFEERTRGKGLIIRGWAPQVLILDHGSVGAFVTHCGWNSTLEGVCAGVPMVTWPVFAEQFINEKLVTDILRTGVGVGSKEWKHTGCDGVKREAVAEAIKNVMESEETRRRAKALKEKAREAVEEGGSSHSGLSDLLDELRSYPRKLRITQSI
ncbi:unnamed protein product [Cuscuta campestris]|uniref:Glycosyltransferase n=1 Tax=Cuscuta campestris TaxID=132261 RepID=A0A484LP72_9ASTE|nr:unnamed protein product [Cuscuta campestris]